MRDDDENILFEQQYQELLCFHTAKEVVKLEKVKARNIILLKIEKF